ncbi:hypothetical protein [Actinoplanes siamensis]|uniref:Uncharacterized protein n=1 Tax=Actinoplanes siamensis TaxID=1223317 RepID=A0A919NDI4_9ACTN|nr:hypothetical protein [Actinoplanes siamensis]GIF08822.1 hypothetical protein Asi03nite_63600 [Actinoplanes siamensis]
MALRRLLVLLLLVPGVIAAAASPAWAAASGGSVRDGMRWSLFLGAGAGLLLLVIVVEMWWLGRGHDRAPVDSDAGDGRFERNHPRTKKGAAIVLDAPAARSPRPAPAGAAAWTRSPHRTSGS